MVVLVALEVRELVAVVPVVAVARELAAAVPVAAVVQELAVVVLVALVLRELVAAVPVARELVAVVPAAVRELPAVVPVAVMVGAILMPVNTVCLTRTGWARRSNGARLGLLMAGFVTVLFIRSANARPGLGGICGDTRRPLLTSTRFTRLSGRSSSRTNQCGRCCRIRNLCGRLEPHWARVPREMMMRRLPAHRSIARGMKFKSRHHPTSSAKASKRSARHRQMPRRMSFRSLRHS
ncbi:hypothetical protein GWG65_22095 [Bradyrhizobium sp. CSA207]|uniref:hypothetical protein n=1 Tax=Bradyrhizobium sp. CSA207 TaxID=2698826 RepID=UPI0023B0D5D8|nr:hypothetical protein [Bradyrhizobium sp. CSA207]MDE5444092.1 hypothetical protein [Bradyrhizobium sp. CSA207]